jgi:stage II sporulation protein D
LEDYVASVVGSEMNFDNHEALKVQAVIARTYALWNISLFHESEYELNDHVLNQVYKGELVFKPQYRMAAEATRGEVLMWSNKLIMAVYHSTCGGRTTSNENVWIGNPLPYLIGVEDNGSCSASPHREWEFSIKRNILYNLIRPDHFGNAQRIDIKERDSFDRVTLLTLVGRNKTHDITVNNLRLILNRHSGPLSIRSSYFSMEISGDSYIFKGKGLGHGVGLCQWGALGLAESGWNYQDILRFYYNGVDILDYSQLKGDGFKLARF